MVKSSSKSLLVKSSSKGLFLAHKTVCGRFILRREAIAWCFEVYFMLCAKPHSSFRIQPVIFIHMDRPQSPKARKAQERICVPRKKRKWDLVNSIISATDWFWSNYFPHTYIHIYMYVFFFFFAIHSWPKSFFYIIPLALDCIETSGYPSLLTLISLQGELRTKRTIQDGGGLLWSSRSPWRPPEKLPLLSLMWPPPRQPPPTCTYTLVPQPAHLPSLDPAHTSLYVWSMSELNFLLS